MDVKQLVADRTAQAYKDKYHSTMDQLIQAEVVNKILNEQNKLLENNIQELKAALEAVKVTKKRKTDNDEF